MKRWISIGAAVLLLGISMAAGSSVLNHSGQVFFHYAAQKGPDQKALEEMESREKEDAIRELPQFAAWRVEEGVEIKSGTLGKRILADCVTVYGAKELANPVRLSVGSFGYSKDKGGCVVSRGLAMELFGSDQVIGMELLCMGKSYKIKGVMDEKKKLVLVPSDGQEKFEYLLFDYGKGESGKTEAQTLLIRYGIGSESVCADGALFGAGSVLFLYAAIISFFFCGLYEFRRQYKKSSSMDGIPIFLILFSALAFFFLLNSQKMTFPQEFIPTKWSDFDFWAARCREIKENMSRLFSVPSAQWVRIVVKKTAVGMGASLLSILCVVKMIFW